MTSIAADLRHAVKLIRRSPGFATITILMIALGIAGNAAVFRVFDGLFLRPLPFDAPEALADLDEAAPVWNLEYAGMAFTDFLDWRRENETFEDMAVFNVYGVNTSIDGATDRSNMASSSHDLPAVLRVEPVTGRFFTAEEDEPNGPRVAVVSQTFWQARLGGADDAVGSTLRINGESHEVIGVFPDVVKRIADADILTPLGLGEWAFGWGLRGIGRLRPGVTLEQAGGDLLRIHKAAVDERPLNAQTFPVVQSMEDRYLGRFRLGSSALLIATGLLLLIACANIAALMFARSLDRTREYGIRMAIGAGRGRLTRQLLTESLVLGALGGALGTLLGYVGSEMLVTEMAGRFPAFVAFDLDLRFVAFVVLATLAGTVAFALLPSLSATDTSPSAVLGNAGARASDSRSKLRKMNLLVAGEVALALLLLIAGGLLVRDVNRLFQTDPGFDPENLLTFGVDLPLVDYETPEQRDMFIRQFLEQVRAVPGVVNATAATSTPLSGHWGWRFRAEGADTRTEEEGDPIVLNQVIEDDYFETLGIRFVAGRPFEASELREPGSAIIVNEAFAAAFLPGVENPVGRRVRPLTGEVEPLWQTIVGVTADVKHYALDQPMTPGVYQAMDGFPMTTARLAVRTAVPPGSLVPTLQALMRRSNPEVALHDVQTMEQRLGATLWARQASSWLTATFSVTALILAVGGIYGVVTHSIRRRRNELCIRMALGADNARVIRQVLAQGLAVIGGGVMVGLLLALGVARTLSSLVATITPTDPVVFVGVTALLVLAASVATFLPARRLARLEPGGALRGD